MSLAETRMSQPRQLTDNRSPWQHPTTKANHIFVHQLQLKIMLAGYGVKAEAESCQEETNVVGSPHD